MTEATKKQQLLAVLITLLLFFTVGYYLFSISLNNKQRTDDLKELVLAQKKVHENILRLQNIAIATSTLSKISARAYLTIAVTENGMQKILTENNSDMALPIASITKLMAAVVTLENLDSKSEVLATKDYIGFEESMFVLETDKKYKVMNLLANALISSDNDSARLVAGTMGTESFISKMNNKAKELGMSNTNFVNSTGLDPSDPTLSLNTSTVADLAKLLFYIKEKHPAILKLTTNTNYNFCDVKNYCKVVMTTNKLLEDSTFTHRILGGKTGTTDLAGKNLVLLVNFSRDYEILNIVLGSSDSFQDTQTLINSIVINI